MELNEQKYFRPLAIVTGASSGIGFVLAKVFGTNGFDYIGVVPMFNQ